MIKRYTFTGFVLSVIVSTMLCMLSPAITAQIPANQAKPISTAALDRLNFAFTPQKGPQVVASSVKPVRGIDVVVLKNPGNSAARIVTTNEKGEADFGILEAGNYSVTLKRQHKPYTITKESGEEIEEVVITIMGAKGGERAGVWSLEKGTFRAPEQSTAKATDAHSIEITTDGHGPTIVFTAVNKSRSNIKNNARTGKLN